MRLESLLTAAPVQVRDGVFDYLGDSSEDYCPNFGVQWNRFRSVQVDSHSKKRQSRLRFLTETGWRPEELKGKLLLDAGCGAGRFAEVALECGASVVAVDLSEAVYACRRTLARFGDERYLVLRADILNLPLRESSFDGVYTLGVVQHMRDPLAGIRGLARYVRPRGRLAAWVYEWRLLRWLQPRIWIRGAVADWSLSSKLALAEVLTALFFPVGWCLSWLGRTGERVSTFLPYAARHHLARGSLRRQWDYCVMDTFDWYGPLYERPQKERDVVETMLSAGLRGVRRLPVRGMAIVGEVPPLPS